MCEAVCSQIKKQNNRSGLVLAALQACNSHGYGAVVSCGHNRRSEIHFRYLR